MLCGPFGSAIRSTAYVEQGIPFIRITNIKLGEFDESDLVYISKADSERLRRTQLSASDLVISQRGTVGNVCQIPESIQVCNISANTIGVKPGNNINPKYLLYFLVSNEGQKQFHRAVSGHVQAKITTSDVESIEVPLPPRLVQYTIADKMDAAYRRKWDLEAEAEALLESIDGYVLEGLGVELPELAQERSFAQQASEVRRGRLDAYYYLPRFTQSLAAFRKSIYPFVPLKQLTTSISGGSTPLGAQYPEKGVPFLRIQNITDGAVDLSDIKYISPETHEQMKRSQLRPLDLLMTITGRVGTCAVVPEDFGDGNINQHIVRMSVTAELDVYYAAEVLNSPIGRLQTERGVTGTTRIALDYPTILQIRIPVPPLGKQRDMAAEVQRRREQAAVLRKEAEQVLAEAKAEVERMILGEGEV